jgi:hypothetical protein
MPRRTAIDKLLLFDDTAVARKRNVALTLNPPQRDADPVIRPDQPWESVGIFGDSCASVVDDDGKVRLWYAAPYPAAANGGPVLTPAEIKGMDEKTLNDARSAARLLLCYAESDDGVHFTKPPLGLIDYEGNPTNIVYTGRCGGTVFIDPTAPPAKRYKMIHGHGPRLPHIRKGSDLPPVNIYHAIYGSWSRDGIHWKTSDTPIMPWYTDTTNVAYWDDERMHYAAFCRYNVGKTYQRGRTIGEPDGWRWRAIGRSVSRDFFKFPKPKVICEPTEAEALPKATGIDYYNSAAMKYPFAPSSYFLFSSDFNHATDQLEVHLATSRDGIHYTRWKKPFIGLGHDGSFDCRRTYMVTGIVRRGNELWMYYLGQNTRHGRKEPKPPYAGGIGRVRLRLDGFVSQDAGEEKGWLLTEPVRLHGDTLAVNADIGVRGGMKVELRSADNKALPGFGPRDADPLSGNNVAHPVTWRGNSSLKPLRSRTVRLRFVGNHFRLFSFECSDRNGETGFSS